MKRNNQHAPETNGNQGKVPNGILLSVLCVGVALSGWSCYAHAAGPRHTTTTTTTAAAVTVASAPRHNSINTQRQRQIQLRRAQLVQRLNRAVDEKARAQAELRGFGINSNLSRRANDEEKKARNDINRGNLDRAHQSVSRLEALTRDLVGLASRESQIRREFLAARNAANRDLATAQRVVGNRPTRTEHNRLNQAQRELSQAQTLANQGRFPQAVSHLERSRRHSGEAIASASRRHSNSNSRVAQRGRR